MRVFAAVSVMRLLAAFAFAAAVLAAAPAHAHWENTRWGMTPEQVVAASGGQARLLPERSRPRIPPLVTVAQGEFLDHAYRTFADSAQTWLTGNAPFTAKLNPAYAPYGDYDQLMRLEEWYGRK